MPSRAKIKRSLQRLFWLAMLFAVCAFSAVATTWFMLKAHIQGEVVVVPNLLGMSPVEARQALEERDLFLLVEEKRVFSHVIPEDKVYLQVPRKDRKIKSGRTVIITLSAGPEEKLIPNVEGETLNFSKTLLGDVGKDVDILSRVPSELKPSGRVIAQSPKAGENPDLLTPTALLISSGPAEPWYVMPDLLGKDLVPVKGFLDRHGFRTITKYQTEDPQMGPVVLRQLPSPGFPIRKSQPITLIVNKEF